MPRYFSVGSREFGVFDVRFQGGGKGISGGRAKGARLCVDDGFERSSVVHRDDRARGRHGFERDEAKVFTNGSVDYTAAVCEELFPLKIARVQNKFDLVFEIKCDGGLPESIDRGGGFRQAGIGAARHYEFHSLKQSGWKHGSQPCKRLDGEGKILCGVEAIHREEADGIRILNRWYVVVKRDIDPGIEDFRRSRCIGKNLETHRASEFAVGEDYVGESHAVRFEAVDWESIETVESA
jgi:hypothetical protein